MIFQCDCTDSIHALNALHFKCTSLPLSLYNCDLSKLQLPLRRVIIQQPEETNILVMIMLHDYEMVFTMHAISKISYKCSYSSIWIQALHSPSHSLSPKFWYASKMETPHLRKEGYQSHSDTYEEGNFLSYLAGWTSTCTGKHADQNRPPLPTGIAAISRVSFKLHGFVYMDFCSTLL